MLNFYNRKINKQFIVIHCKSHISTKSPIDSMASFKLNKSIKKKKQKLIHRIDLMNEFLSHIIKM